MSYVVFVDLIEMFVNRYVGFALPSFVFYGLCGLGGLVVQMLFNQITMSIVDPTLHSLQSDAICHPNEFPAQQSDYISAFSFKGKGTFDWLLEVFRNLPVGSLVPAELFYRIRSLHGGILSNDSLIGCWNFLISKNRFGA